MPDWKDAPEWAQWLAQDSTGQWAWYECKPMLANDKTWFVRVGQWSNWQPVANAIPSIQQRPGN